MLSALEWEQDVLDERAWREAHYVDDDSPLLPAARAAFPGIDWWPIDPACRITGVRLTRHPAPLSGRLAATGPDAVELLEIGSFAFEMNGAPCRLLAYEPAPGESDEPYILIPFRDGTSNAETYGAGRYLDVEPNAEDVYTLDFNRAYHPYCAFDDTWACILPPPANTLKMRVEAGERLVAR